MKLKLLATSIVLGLANQATAATYQLTELARHEQSKYTYVTDANEAGDVIGYASGLFNLPVDVSYIDFEDSGIKRLYDQFVSNYELREIEVTFTLEDIENDSSILKTNEQAHAFMLDYLQRVVSSSQKYQKLYSAISLTYDNNSANEHVLFDVEKPEYDGLTRSVSNYLTSIASDGTLASWGSAPYEKTVFTKEGETEEETYFVRDWESRGLLESPSGKRVVIEPEFDQYGGTVVITDIKLDANGNYQVVGQSSTGLQVDRAEDIAEKCDGVDNPVKVCIAAYGNIYHKRAYKWVFDAELNLLSKENLGLGFSPDEDDDNAYSSIAMAVNSDGVAVGYSRARRQSDDRLLPLVQAGYYQDGEFKRIKEVEYYSEFSRAVDINDNNIMVGVKGLYSSYNRAEYDSKGFYFDINAGAYHELPSYHEGSELAVKDINNHGVIVGQAEVEKNTSSSRREAFLYNLGDEKLTNLNSLLPCRGDDFPYVVAEAVKVTDDNKIYAIATKTVEKRDSLGQIKTNSKGETEYESVTLPVLLTPIAGEVESCTPPEAETYERKSGGWGLLSLVLLPLVYLRRRFNLK
ncbi:DUF3466 family protein [Pseudoalteromonas sp. T1lg65]|uniref:DUF3466 family protein n=1 Tax=Pseudoalteromonas sp. T1lg65 TaxID=2077101 RepID=UPI003F7A5AEE